MNKTIVESIELVNGLKRNLDAAAGVDVVVCPPFTALCEVNETLIGSNIALGAQDLYWQSKGAFTGEISAAMLKDVGCKYVIIGHSERRQFFSENNETVNKKLKAAMDAGLTPIVCVGENLRERESNKTFDVLNDHVVNGLSNITREDALKIIIAYEPVWAIGTGKVAAPAQAQEAHKFIRERLVKLFGQETANSIRIQYGGSVKPENIKDLISQPDVDGALVGGASLELETFSKIVEGAIK